jgi:hypothetical protein
VFTETRISGANFPRTTDVNVGKGVGDETFVIVGVGDSTPVRGTGIWAVCVNAAAEVPATAVLMAFESSAGAGTPGEAQAMARANNKETSRKIRMVFTMGLPSVSDVYNITIKDCSVCCKRSHSQPGMGNFIDRL